MRQPTNWSTRCASIVVCSVQCRLIANGVYSLLLPAAGQGLSRDCRSQARPEGDRPVSSLVLELRSVLIIA